MQLIKAIILLKKYLTVHHFDVVIAQAFLPAFLLWIIGYKGKVIVCEHFKYELYGTMMTRLRDHVYKKFDKVVTLTDKDKDKFARVGIAAVTIPNMISFPISKHTHKGTRCVAVGRLHPQKGFDMLIKAISPVLKNNPSWYLDIYGEGSEYDALQILIEDNDMGDQIVLRGYSNNIQSEISNSDILIVSSRYEGFPMSITEALALGTPIVSFDCPEGPATLLNDGAGLLVPPENVKVLSESIARMIDSEELRESCRIKGYRNISQYTPEKITGKWRDLFDSMNI